jgi:hypothetical protein
MGVDAKAREAAAAELHQGRDRRPEIEQENVARLFGERALVPKRDETRGTSCIRRSFSTAGKPKNIRHRSDRCMKYFFDTEFIEDGNTIDLISIGMVCDDGRELYMVSSEFDETKADDWVRKHVLNHIPRELRRFTRREIANAVNAFTLEPLVRHFPEAPTKNRKANRPQMWAYYADYDWIVLCQLYGRMKDAAGASAAVLPRHQAVRR